MRLLLLLCSLSLWLFGFNAFVSDAKVANGKTTLVEIKKEDGYRYRGIKLASKEFELYDHPKKAGWLYAIVPISYYQKPEDMRLVISFVHNSKEQSRELFIKVEDGKYEKEKISVQPSKVKPSGKNKERAEREYAEAMKIYSKVTQKNYLVSAFIYPMQSKITSDFGKARVYNDTLNGFHGGTDFRADVGTPIVAVNDGVVVLASDRFYSGNSMIIDHGRGVYSCYFHMSRFDVKVGDIVKRGVQIGLSGKSGRVTGPHLHFAIRVNNTLVDPMQFIATLNQNLLQE